MSAGMRREQGNFGSAALIPETQAAMAKYLYEIDTLLGSEGGLEDFEPLQQGTFHDMIQESTRVSRSLLNLKNKQI